MSEFAKYIGLPWEAGTCGPDKYDCMSLVVHIQSEHFGITMADIVVPDYGNEQGIAELMSGHVELENWERVNKPKHGDVVFLKKPRRHFGVWLDIDGGGVLHCTTEINTVFSKDSAWHVSGFGRRIYYRHRSKL